MTEKELEPPDSCPTATLVITCRERHGLTEGAIESVVRNTRKPVRLLYIDVCTPEWLRARISDRAAEWSLEVIRLEGTKVVPMANRAFFEVQRSLAPNEAAPGPDAELGRSAGAGADVERLAVL